MAQNAGITIGSVVFIIGVVIIAFAVPHAHPQPPQVLKISATPNEIAINNTSQDINVTVNYSYSYQNPDIRIISPTVSVHNDTTGQNFSYAILSSFSETIATQSVVKTTQTSQTTLELGVNPGAYKVMGNSTYLLKIIIEDPSLTYKFGQANVTLIAS